MPLLAPACCLPIAVLGSALVSSNSSAMAARLDVVPEKVEWNPINKKRAKGRWSYDKCKDLTKLWIEELAPAAIELFRQGASNGTILVEVKMPFHPKKKHVELNFAWVKPVVQMVQEKVASAYFMADALMIMHKELGEKLLVPGQSGMNEEMLALREAMNLRKIVSYARSLWRTSPSSRSKRIAAIKNLMREKNASDSDSDDPEAASVGSSSEDDSGSGDNVIVVSGADDESEGKGASDSGDESEGECESEDEDESKGKAASDADLEAEGKGASDSEVEADDASEGKGESEADDESKGKGESEADDESEGKGASETDDESEGKGESEADDESEGKGASETEYDCEPENCQDKDVRASGSALGLQGLAGRLGLPGKLASCWQAGAATDSMQAQPPTPGRACPSTDSDGGSGSGRDSQSEPHTPKDGADGSVGASKAKKASNIVSFDATKIEYLQNMWVELGLDPVCFDIKGAIQLLAQAEQEDAESPPATEPYPENMPVLVKEPISAEGLGELLAHEPEEHADIQEDVASIVADNARQEAPRRPKRPRGLELVQAAQKDGIPIPKKLRKSRQKKEKKSEAGSCDKSGNHSGSDDPAGSSRDKRKDKGRGGRGRGRGRGRACGKEKDEPKHQHSAGSAPHSSGKSESSKPSGWPKPSNKLLLKRKKHGKENAGTADHPPLAYVSVIPKGGTIFDVLLPAAKKTCHAKPAKKDNVEKENHAPTTDDAQQPRVYCLLPQDRLKQQTPYTNKHLQTHMPMCMHMGNICMHI